MRRFLLTAAAAFGLCILAAGLQAADDAKQAADDAKDKEVTGVLIDNTCGRKQTSEEAAANHPKSCAMKDGCAKSGYGVFSGKKLIKFDEAGNAKAKEFLAVKENTTKIIAVGALSEDGKTLAVKEIKAAPKKEEKGA